MLVLKVSAKVVAGPSDPYVMDEFDAKATTITLEDVAFYLDAIDRDRLDAAGASRRASELSALRSSMMRLSDEAFESAMRTIRHIVADAAQEGGRDGKPDADAKKRRHGAELYERSTGRTLGGSSAAQKIAPA